MPSWRTADEALARMVSEGESSASHAALVDYAYMGEHHRSLKRLVESYQERKRRGEDVPSVRLPTLETWSARFAWQDRIRVFDMDQRARRMLANQAELDTMHKRHAQLAQAFQAKVLEWLKDPLSKIYQPQDAATFLKLAVSIERQSRGVPSVVAELHSLTDQQLLDRYMGLIEALKQDESVLDNAPMLELLDDEATLEDE